MYVPLFIWEATHVKVLYEDEHLMIVNKPYGIKTHPNQPQETDTLLNHVVRLFSREKSGPLCRSSIR